MLAHVVILIENSPPVENFQRSWSSMFVKGIGMSLILLIIFLGRILSKIFVFYRLEWVMKLLIGASLKIW